MEGITCTVYHKIQDDGQLGTSASFSGNWTIDFNAKPKPLFGPYSDPVREMMMGYQATHSTHLGTSEFCGLCHEIRTPMLDAQGNIVAEDEFQEQTTYNEWKYSAYADLNQLKTCQDCHMPKANSVTVNPQMQRDNWAMHTFVGSNTTMLDILKRNADVLAVDSKNTDFDSAMKRIRSSLVSKKCMRIQQQFGLNG